MHSLIEYETTDMEQPQRRGRTLRGQWLRERSMLVAYHDCRPYFVYKTKRSTFVYIN